MCNAITKMDTVAKIRSLKWSFGRVMGKYENLNEKIVTADREFAPEPHPGRTQALAANNHPNPSPKSNNHPHPHPQPSP